MIEAFIDEQIISTDKKECFALKMIMFHYKWSVSHHFEITNVNKPKSYLKQFLVLDFGYIKLEKM